MDGVLEKSAVKRVKQALTDFGLSTEITVLMETARSAAEAASALGIEVGQIASSIIFKINDEKPLLVITSGRHRVNTELVAPCTLANTVLPRSSMDEDSARIITS
ncbi:MAG: hypothetical protein EBY12_02865 [Actinobacteria bacterium]|nr:hypothetical protein [Actinomycetota bacterium]